MQQQLEIHKFKQKLTMVVDLNERGWFKAHVENGNGKTVFQFSNENDLGWPDEDGLWLVEFGYMKHPTDTRGLLDYLVQMGIAKPGATIDIIH